MRNLFTFLALIIMGVAQAGITPKKVAIKPNSTVSFTGNLNQGEVLTDLSWAWKSSVACFPATQQKSFNGSHVLYETTLPPHAILEITLKPKKQNAKMSIYGYQVGTKSTAIVPNLSSCVSCEADNNQMGKALNNHRSIRLNAINNPYKVYFAVVGENGLAEGDFEVVVKLEGGEEPDFSMQKPVPVKLCKAPEQGKALAYKDNLSAGEFVYDLSWAWKSSTACFPETQKQSFTGKHIMFETTIPRYSTMTITLMPKDPNKEMSLYGYQIGLSKRIVVPNLTSCVTCEADNNQMGKATNNRRQIKFTAINNPYKVMIGVAGVKGLDTGEFVIQINLEAR
ncbi:MAG: hypothetical protein ACWA41_03035 [Putridiphycobacter sp.]